MPSKFKRVLIRFHKKVSRKTYNSYKKNAEFWLEFKYRGTNADTFFCQRQEQNREQN